MVAVVAGVPSTHGGYYQTNAMDKTKLDTCTYIILHTIAVFSK